MTAAAYELHHGDVLDVLPTLEADSFDAMLTDPPYGLEFMGREWDQVVPGVGVWRECLRVLKPGAFALVFGGTRTFHRLAIALEDAGFELRDTLMWVYGSGFPKSHDVSKAIDKMAGAEREVVGPGPYADRGRRTDNVVYNATTPSERETITAPATPEAERWQGYGTSLKPAYEPILLVRKPTPLTYARNALEHGTGALNIDGARVGSEGGGTKCSNRDVDGKCLGHPGRSGTALGLTYHGSEATEPEGRWPANLIHDGSDEVVSLFPHQKSGGTPPRRPADKNRVAYGAFHGQEAPEGIGSTSGSAARFFYAAKASTAERNAGLSERCPHPTVKPLALTRYLATLLLPPERDTPRRLLVPFAGSGSEMIGARQAGWDEVVGIEREAEYVAIAEARLAHWTKGIQLGLACLEAV